MEASLYIHVPFCAGVCDYCDFYSVPVKTPDKRTDLFIDAVSRDAEALLRDFAVTEVPTVYIGGGTPSVLGAKGAARLLSAVGAALPPPVFPREWTVEANPESAGPGFLEACRAGGVTRVSLGVQTFHEPSRRALRRTGRGSLVPERLSLVREIFGASFSADLLSGLPLQDEDTLKRDIDTLLSYGPGHVSLYSLTVAPGTPLAEKSGVPGFLPDCDRADLLWLAGRDMLVQAGYGQYEVSNFALAGRRCAHNIRYWRMENWLGLGPAASGTVIDGGFPAAGRRFTGPDLDAWLAPRVPGSRADTVEFLDASVLMKESLLMGFRYAEGPDEDLFVKRFGLSVEEAIPQTARKWRARGLLLDGPREGDGPRLSAAGLLFLNPFLLDAFAECG
ncbi:MAG: coproporphyrinogen III oxidase family protein [Treponema sp.]|jgi:oxygen-independent coproporphyrinogen-3 oxidase|nr:coproporphyrinogen III oxidase family protein [Treponema sp.]